MNTDATRILILAANPTTTTSLRLEEEVREVEDVLKSAKYRDRFELTKKSAVRTRDMLQAMIEVKPNIVHFSGHGAGTEGLVLEDDAGQPKTVRTDTLAKLFKLQEQVTCVVLNACYSEVQANEIVQHIPHVIGMNQAIGDDAAREFAIGFYSALGAGEAIEAAFGYGCCNIGLEGIPEELTPILKQRGELASSAPVVVEEPMPDNPRKLTVVVAPNSSDAEKQSEPSSPKVTTTKPVVLANPEGTVSLNSPFYVKRPPIEDDCYETIEQEGELIRIKAPRQMGKSSLMQRVLNHARQQGHRTVYLNFLSIDSGLLTSLNSFLRWFCAKVSEELELKNRLDDYWDDNIGSKSSCTKYFERYLLKNLSEPLTLGLDEVDQVFQHPEIAQDFFPLLRNWNEDGKIKPQWGKLRLVIVHSKEVYIPLNIHQSPFNVGLAIDLPELTKPQVEDLVSRHGLNWSSVEIEQLMSIVDGHPYLLRKALYKIARRELTLSEFMQVAPTEEGLFGDHLRRHLLNLEDDPELRAGMQQVISATKPVCLDPSVAFKLRSMGLVELQGNGVIPLCNLYRLYFRDRLGVE
ncbi:AAA-like domain-containing protein [Leptolyngbya sp. FACHB-17]|uniref:AAA-like domain-containing protein n=1 Tax=unclassified Leptolyngbya TaxID=2650499 RepID=UPI0016804871|nr:AAA-like domain-containing protein [Leptolyngbya sp. FACHB-17]MBD2080630.1 AAA-like domain-containing protein [Leptolyngbya sp. FACHB-17]